MKLVKLFWRIDKAYTIILIISMVLMWISLFKKDLAFSAWQGLIMYISFNELRYEYDSKIFNKN